jgi:curli biogenesis system outer membrane secretion channel CsgG
MRVLRFGVRLCASLCLPIVVGVAHAQVQFKDVEATGHGGDESSATLEALQSALSTVGGMKLSASIGMSVSETVRGDAVGFNQDYRQDIERITRGVIKSYRVVQKGVSPGSGQTFVRVVATIPTYRPSEHLKRLKLAVVPLAIHPKLQADRDARKFADDVSAALESSLTQSRRFAMLDRRFGAQASRELSSIIGGATPIEETVKLGMTAGADYIVVAALRDYAAQNVEGRSPLGRPIVRLNAPVAIDVRVIDIATRQIKYAQSYVHPGRLPASVNLNQHAANIGAEIGESIGAAIFPIAVVALSGVHATFNQGGETVQVGRRYSLVVLGRNLVDPYTKESLGQEEHEVGRAEVISVTDRTAVARVISGAPQEAKGQLLARALPDGMSLDPAGSASDATGGATVHPRGIVRGPEASSPKTDNW